MIGRDIIDELREQDRLRRELLGGFSASDRLRREAMGLSATLASERLFQEAAGFAQATLASSIMQSETKRISDLIQGGLLGGLPQSYSDRIDDQLKSLIAAPNVGRLIAETAGTTTATRFLDQARMQGELASAMIGAGGYFGSLHTIDEFSKSLRKQQAELAGLFSHFTPDQLGTLRSATLEAATRVAEWKLSDSFDIGEWEEVEETPHALVVFLLTIVKAFGANSAKQFKEFGPLQIATLISLLSALHTLLGEPAYTPADREKAAVVAERVEQVQGQLSDVLARKVQEAQFVDTLPKGITRGQARMREAPSRAAKIVARFDLPTTVAIVEKQGRWAKIVFADPLTGNFRLGWVWRGSIDQL